jgi:hypothetical protein
VTFEERFFGPGNLLRWEAIRAGTLAPSVSERIGPFLEGLRGSPTVLVLPRALEGDRVLWYALCDSARTARTFRDELRAFLGTSYSDFEGRLSRLDPNDPVEAAVLERCPHHAVRFEVPDRALFEAARGRLRLLLRLRGERPARHGKRVRATGRVLRDFEYSLVACDGDTAADCIAELRGVGGLDATSLLFLEVRRHAALGQWQTLLALPEMGSLLRLRRPRRVTEAIIQAVYAVHLQEFEIGPDPAGAINRFRSELVPQYGDLYRTRAGLSGYEVDASFVIAAAVSGGVASAADDATGSAHLEPHRRAFVEAVARHASARVDIDRRGDDPLTEARGSFAAGDVDRAFALASALQPSFDRCALLLRCARDMGTLDATRAALAAFESLADEERERLQSHGVLARILVALSEFVARSTQQPSQEVPASWSAWLDRLASADPWRAAVAVAEAGGREWSLEDVLADTGSSTPFAERLLADLPAWGQAALRDGLPYLLECLLAQGPDARLKATYDSLFLLLAVDEHISVPQFSAITRVAEARIGLGVSADGYREIVRQLAAAAGAVGSPAVVDQALDAIDVLVNAPCADAAERQGFAISVATLCHQWFRRVDSAQWTLLRTLAAELGLPTDAVQQAAENESTEHSDWTTLAGRKIALYSLRESALRRTVGVLRELCPTARVEAFGDHVGGSAALRTASATVDIFVVAWAAAKHAATQFIEAHRPKDKVTLYARGQGSASLLAALKEHVDAGAR